MEENIKCPYCGKGAIWTSNEVVYGRRYGKSWMCYWCADCDAYVGCHNNTRKPLGTMANKELRQERMKTHAVIDLLWKSGKFKRKEVYRRLSEELGHDVHIGGSTKEECAAIVQTAQMITNEATPKNKQEV